jgi:hypothetical protein
MGAILARDAGSTLVVHATQIGRRREMGRWIWIVMALAACSKETKGDAPSAKVKNEGATRSSTICDARQLDQLDDIATLKTSTFYIAAAITAEACRLPDKVEQALAELGQTSSCGHAVPAIAEAPDLFLKVCPAGHESVRVFGPNDVPTANRLFAEACDLPRLGFATLEELTGAHHYAGTILGSMVYMTLEEAGEPRAKEIARRLVLDRS